ncbi:MAG: hypothetical protein ACKOW9_06330 [Candidatus Paceibacterota bacterium]
MSRLLKLSVLFCSILGLSASVFLIDKFESAEPDYIRCSTMVSPESYLTCMENESGADARRALLRLFANKSDIEIDSRCHDVAHSYGRELWRSDGIEGFNLGLGVLEMCQYGVLHSFLFESGTSFSSNEFKEFISESVLPKCEELNSDGNLFVEQCYHGIGHAIANRDGSTGADYVIDFCSIAPGEGGVESCVRGAIMEMSWAWITSDVVTSGCDGYGRWDVVCRQIVYASYYGEYKFDGLAAYCDESENDLLGCGIGVGQQLVREINSNPEIESSFDECVEITNGVTDNGELACVDAFSRSLLLYTGGDKGCDLIGQYREVCVRVVEAFRLELLGPRAVKS